VQTALFLTKTSSEPSFRKAYNSGADLILMPLSRHFLEQRF
jgi:hypothetical protein